MVNVRYLYFVIFNLARKLLLRKYNWRRVGILYQYERQYTMVSNCYMNKHYYVQIYSY